ncbi:MAG: hypothetical protein AAFP92_03900, partial [Bacteroidota bacterium]
DSQRLIWDVVPDKQMTVGVDLGVNLEDIHIKYVTPEASRALRGRLSGVSEIAIKISETPDISQGWSSYLAHPRQNSGVTRFYRFWFANGK